MTLPLSSSCWAEASSPSGFWPWSTPCWADRLPAVLELLSGLLILAVFIGYFYSTRQGKLLVWSELLDDLGLRGDEQVLDMGCGRGAVLSMVAKRLDRGRAFGLDLWSSVDQSGNNREATLRNLEVEGVRENAVWRRGT